MPQNTNKRYSEKDINFIKNNYKNMSVKKLAAHLKRTPKSVRSKIERLNISLNDLERNKSNWSEKEVKILKENYLLPDHKIQELLPNFSRSQIVRKRLKLDLRKQTYEPYINGEYYQYYKNGKTIWVHKEEAEKKLNRKLNPEELVHHVDGNKINNSHNNLFVCKDRKHHGKVHANLEKVAFKLVEKGLIKFDHKKGKYYLSE